MHREPVSPDPRRSCPDWMDDPAYLGMRSEDEDPGDLDLDVAAVLLSPPGPLDSDHRTWSNDLDI